MHLSSSTSISIMVFYSLLTFFVGPYLTKSFIDNTPDNCLAGFTLGFAISIILWIKYGKKVAIRSMK